MMLGSYYKTRRCIFSLAAAAGFARVHQLLGATLDRVLEGDVDAGFQAFLGFVRAVFRIDRLDLHVQEVRVHVRALVKFAAVLRVALLEFATRVNYQNLFCSFHKSLVNILNTLSGPFFWASVCLLLLRDLVKVISMIAHLESLSPEPFYLGNAFPLPGGLTVF